MNRAQLLGVLDTLLDELTGQPGDPALFWPDARIVESNKPSARGEGLWANASRIGGYRIVAADEARQTAGFMGLVWRGEVASMVGLSIALRGDRIGSAEIIVAPERFPGEAGVDARTLETVRPCFAQPLTASDRLSRGHLEQTAQGYYAAVNQSNPDLAKLAPDGVRIEAGTQITANPAFHFAFYTGLDGQLLPNFGEWTAREQFRRGLWNADGVLHERYPIVDMQTGVVFAFTTYCPWHKRFEVEVAGVGRVGPVVAGRRVALNMLEAFKIEHGAIAEMESVWEIEDAPFSPIMASVPGSF